jgi:glyoxylase-like metal-dependent hydrolase (beta-lactamase superfamily II)/rhodanese-related sulfurtransferase
MYFEQFYLSCLAHASYMLGSEGVAAVVDPQRDVEIYLEEARKNDLKITHIIETHLHADFVSGHQELAARAGAKIYLGRAAEASFPHVPVKDGEEIRCGRVVLRFLETPGHSVDSICVLVTDLDRSPDPWAVLTGDTLFVGEVGRPDLSPFHSPQELAALLYDSLHGKLLKLPDHVEVYPAHGAGSLCGRNICTERSTTIGKERALNYALRPMSREEFIRFVVADLPERPEYFFRDKELNRAGAPALTELPPLKALAPEEVRHLQAKGTAVLDTRPASNFGAGHVPASYHIPLSGQYASWAGTLLGLEKPIILAAEDEAKIEESRLRLARVGIEQVVAYLAGGILAWERAGLPVETVPQISVLQLFEQLNDPSGDLQVLDVRRPSEWDAGHLERAQLKPLHRLSASLADLDPRKPTAVHCQSGYRSSIGTSLLRQAGFKEVMNVVGGFDAWQAHKLPFVLEDRATTAVGQVVP